MKGFHLAAGVLAGLVFCALNRPVFLWVNGISMSGLDWLMLSITSLGNGLVAAVLVLLLSPFRRDITIRAAVAMILAGILTTLLKEALALPRPLAVFGDAVKVLGPELRSNSMPSGHTATAFALACSLKGLVSDRVYRAVLVLAVLVGVSRVYAGAHFPLDVLVGALLGWFSVQVTQRYSERFALYLAGPRPFLDRVLLGLAALSGFFLAFFDPMVRYNPWFLRPLGIAGMILSLSLMIGRRVPGEP